ncbi:MAG: hypothetical protein ACI9LM_003596 [Alteromonadaceae bacterium]|jgi:hypothetical protein
MYKKQATLYLSTMLIDGGIIMQKEKFVRGHFISKGNFQSIDGNHSIAFGDEFNITDILKDNRVEVTHDNQCFTFDMNSFDVTFISFDQK